MRRDSLDAAVLEGLQHRLMDPALCNLFCEEYARQMNRVHGENNAQREDDRGTLAKIERDLDRLVQALMDGVPASRVKDKMADLENRKVELEARLKDGQDSSILIHPRMANYYRDGVARLREALSGDDGHDAMGVIRRLIDRIVLTKRLLAKKASARVLPKS